MFAFLILAVAIAPQAVPPCADRGDYTVCEAPAGADLRLFLDGADGLRCTHGIVCAAGRRDERTGFRLATKDPAILGDLRTL